MKIPVFHDDQHGTAIILGAAFINALSVIGKKPDEIKIVHTGAGAAGISCMDMLVHLGVPKENIWVADRHGVIHSGRDDLDENKRRYARDTDARTLDDIIDGADMFVGLSGPGALTQAMVARMVERPIIFALANPTPEILPELVKEVRPDAIVATGRSDYPNQVNNALCFPYLFRGALDVGATVINEAMKIACVKAIADLARREMSDVVGARLRRPDALVRCRIPDSATVRSAPADRAVLRSRRGGDGIRRGDASDQRHRGLSRAPQHLRVPHRPGHEAGVRPRAQRHRSASSMPKAKRKPCCAQSSISPTTAWPGRS